jgi:3-methyl-2-oxobutanoate hydroxymethyltransferase
LLVVNTTEIDIVNTPFEQLAPSGPVKGRSRIGMLTAYDYPSAEIADAAGRTSSSSVTPSAWSVARGSKTSLIVGDMRYLSYHVSIDESGRNAGHFTQAGAHAVKRAASPIVLECVPGELASMITVRIAPR